MPLNTALLARRMFFVLCVALCVLFIGWLIEGDSSPLSEYFLWHLALPNAWVTINMPAVFLGVAVSGNIHQPSPVGYWLGVSLQWGVLAFLASLLVVRASTARKTDHVRQR